MKNVLKIQLLAIVLACFGFASDAAGADGPCIVPGKGHFYIHTGTSGLFGAFAHDHVVEAQRIDGCAVIDSNVMTRSSVRLVFTTAAVRVIDPSQSAGERAKVQKTMEAEVLQVSQFPEAIFESTAIEKGNTADAFRVRGSLTIRGKTEQIVVPVTFTRLNDGTYRASGEYKFKQTTFGIKPVQLGGGTVKVKDEVRTEFELFLK